MRGCVCINGSPKCCGHGNAFSRGGRCRWLLDCVLHSQVTKTAHLEDDQIHWQPFLEWAPPYKILHSEMEYEDLENKLEELCLAEDAGVKEAETKTSPGQN